MAEKKAAKLLVDGFGGFTDSRMKGKIKYPLDEIALLVVCAAVCGCDDWEEIEDFGEEKLEWLRKYLPYENGIPSHDTINRVTGSIKPSEFESLLVAWSSNFKGDRKGLTINLDGKRISCSADKADQQKKRCDGGKYAVHIVSAWANELGICLGQVDVGQKCDELAGMMLVLNAIGLADNLVTVDANGCRPGLCGYVVGEKGDYLIGLKQNNPGLYGAAVGLFGDAGNVSDSHDWADKGHGRVERRICRTVDISGAAGTGVYAQWTGLKTLVEIESYRLITASGKEETEKRYYICSKAASAKWANEHVRKHWGIENNLHHTLDVTFGEDGSRKRDKNAAVNFATVRKLAINTLKTGTDEKISMKRKMKKCSMSDEYREKVLQF